MKKLIIDRFEGEYAVCEHEDRNMIELKKSSLPQEAAEGSCIIVNDDGSIVLDMDEFDLRNERITKMMDDLFE
jgi:hypothetical protein